MQRAPGSAGARGAGGRPRRWDPAAGADGLAVHNNGAALSMAPQDVNADTPRQRVWQGMSAGHLSEHHVTKILWTARGVAGNEKRVAFGIAPDGYWKEASGEARAPWAVEQQPRGWGLLWCGCGRIFELGRRGVDSGGASPPAVMVPGGYLKPAGHTAPWGDGDHLEMRADKLAKILTFTINGEYVHRCKLDDSVQERLLSIGAVLKSPDITLTLRSANTRGNSAKRGGGGAAAAALHAPHTGLAATAPLPSIPPIVSPASATAAVLGEVDVCRLSSDDLKTQRPVSLFYSTAAWGNHVARVGAQAAAIAVATQAPQLTAAASPAPIAAQGGAHVAGAAAPGHPQALSQQQQQQQQLALEYHNTTAAAMPLKRAPGIGGGASVGGGVDRKPPAPRQAVTHQHPPKPARGGSAKRFGTGTVWGHWPCAQHGPLSLAAGKKLRGGPRDYREREGKRAHTRFSRAIARAQAEARRFHAAREAEACFDDPAPYVYPHHAQLEELQEAPAGAGAHTAHAPAYGNAHPPPEGPAGTIPSLRITVQQSQGALAPDHSPQVVGAGGVRGRLPQVVGADMGGAGASVAGDAASMQLPSPSGRSARSAARSLIPEDSLADTSEPASLFTSPRNLDGVPILDPSAAAAAAAAAGGHTTVAATPKDSRRVSLALNTSGDSPDDVFMSVDELFGVLRGGDGGGNARGSAFYDKPSEGAATNRTAAAAAAGHTVQVLAVPTTATPRAGSAGPAHGVVRPPPFTPSQLRSCLRGGRGAPSSARGSAAGLGDGVGTGGGYGTAGGSGFGKPAVQEGAIPLNHPTMRTMFGKWAEAGERPAATTAVPPGGASTSTAEKHAMQWGRSVYAEMEAAVAGDEAAAGTQRRTPHPLRLATACLILHRIIPKFKGYASLLLDCLHDVYDGLFYDFACSPDYDPEWSAAQLCKEVNGRPSGSAGVHVLRQPSAGRNGPSGGGGIGVAPSAATNTQPPPRERTTPAFMSLRTWADRWEADVMGAEQKMAAIRARMEGTEGAGVFGAGLGGIGSPGLGTTTPLLGSARRRSSVHALGLAGRLYTPRGQRKLSAVDDELGGDLGDSFFQDYVPEDLSILTHGQLKAYATMLLTEVEELREGTLRSHFRVWREGARTKLFRDVDDDHSADPDAAADPRQWLQLMESSRPLKLLRRCWQRWRSEYVRRKEAIESHVKSKMLEAEVKRLTENKDARVIPTVNDTSNEWDQLVKDKNRRRRSSASVAHDDSESGVDVLDEAAAAWAVDVEALVIGWLEKCQDPHLPFQCASNCTTSLQDGGVLHTVIASFPEGCFRGVRLGTAGDALQRLNKFFEATPRPLAGVAFHPAHLDRESVAMTYLCLTQLLEKWLAAALALQADGPDEGHLEQHAVSVLNNLSDDLAITSASGWTQVREKMRIFAVDALVEACVGSMHGGLHGLVAQHAMGELHQELMENTAIKMSIHDAQQVITALFARYAPADALCFTGYETFLRDMEWWTLLDVEAVHLTYLLAYSGCAHAHAEDVAVGEPCLDSHAFGELFCILSAFFGVVNEGEAEDSVESHIAWFLEEHVPDTVAQRLPDVWSVRQATPISPTL